MPHYHLMCAFALCKILVVFMSGIFTNLKLAYLIISLAVDTENQNLGCVKCIETMSAKLNKTTWGPEPARHWPLVPISRHW